jgi:hypothetical protein
VTLRRGAALLALGLAAWGGAGMAEAPETSLRPLARAEPEPPGRPLARPGDLGAATLEVAGAEGGSPLRLQVRPFDGPFAQLGAPMLTLPAGPSLLPELTGDDSPAIARQPPLIESEPAEPVLAGPPQIVRAEMLMSEIPEPPVIVGGWEGEVPPARPVAEPPKGGLPEPGRPRLRPATPQDPVPLLPPDPDAPPAYAPDARPDILPVGPEYSVFAVARAILPQPRPASVTDRAEQVRVERVRGQVCGNPLIQGEVAAPVRDGGGCGIEEPVRVRSVDGVRLSEAALVDCGTAEALLDWVQDAARPAVGSRGGGLASLQIAGSYSCRPRNNQAGARLSEHGKGRAVDIAAVVMADGSRLTVAGDWPDPALTRMHGAACGIFNTTLGPGSDGFHEDHLHFDTAPGRGPYCR